jgi:hypothetical protein
VLVFLTVGEARTSNRTKLQDEASLHKSEEMQGGSNVQVKLGIAHDAFRSTELVVGLAVHFRYGKVSSYRLCELNPS